MLRIYVGVKKVRRVATADHASNIEENTHIRIGLSNGILREKTSELTKEFWKILNPDTLIEGGGPTQTFSCGQHDTITIKDFNAIVVDKAVECSFLLVAVFILNSASLKK